MLNLTMKLTIVLLLVCIHSTASLLGLVGSTQSAAATGRLTCNGKPAANVLVKMYDNDVLYDSAMGETHTDASGQFSIQGTGKEVSTIDPKVNFYHDCNKGALRCSRKFTIKLPHSYVTKGSTPNKVYDFGQMELAGKMPGESHDCIHRH